MSLPPYEYEPLQAPDAVRVLVLKPSAEFAAELECDMIQYSRLDSLCSLGSTTQYSAVSYAWGQPVFSHYIRCTSTATPSLIRVTANVDVMLRHFRHHVDMRYLWIDAICLNQDDEVEKAAQIPLMGPIYEQARAVHVWLGPDQGDAKVMFAFIRSLATVPNDSPVEMGYVAELIRRILGDAADRILRTFWDLPWFTRRWILQEVLLGQQVVVHYGREQLPWSGLTLAMKKLEAASANGGLDITMHPTVTALGTLSKIIRGTSHILELMWEFHNWQCSDPKDRLFSLHGLCHRGLSADLPAYTLSSTDAYTSYAKTCIDQGYEYITLIHLVAFGPLNNHNDRLPSWVPDWSLTRKDFHIPSRKAVHKSGLEEYRQTHSILAPRRTGLPTKQGECVFRGYYFGDVVMVMQRGTSWEHTRQLYYSFCEVPRPPGHHRAGLHPLLTLFQASSFDDILDTSQKLAFRLLTADEGKPSEPLTPAEPAEEEAFRRMHENLSKYALVKTDRGLFGYVSPILSNWHSLEVFGIAPLMKTRKQDGFMDWNLALVVPKQGSEYPSTVHRKVFGVCFHSSEGGGESSEKEVIVS